MGSAQPPTSTFGLLERARQGDQAGFALLFQKYAPRLAVLIHCKLGSDLRAKLEVDDVLQEVFLAALQRFGGVLRLPVEAPEPRFLATALIGNPGDVGAALVVVSTWVASINMFVILARWRRENKGARIPLLAYISVFSYAMWDMASVPIAVSFLVFGSTKMPVRQAMAWLERSVETGFPCWPFFWRAMWCSDRPGSVTRSGI